MNVAATVQSADVPLVVEHVWIQNVSNCGARIFCKRVWRERERLVLTSSLGDLHTEAEVVYVQRLANGECAIGVKFSVPLAASNLISGQA